MTETDKPETAKGAQFSRSRIQEIQSLPVSEKLELAKVANTEMRAILIRDGNEQVQKAVLDSARITEKEIIAIAKSRKLGDSLLRKIATNLRRLKN